MKFAQPVKLGALLIVILNVLMAFGCIWIFMRMAPAIEVIISHNQVSLHATEKMFAALSSATSGREDAEVLLDDFDDALTLARHNITEPEEPLLVAAITENYRQAFQGDKKALHKTVKSLVALGNSNRAATRRADIRAKQLGFAGAWGVVFMASTTFIIGMIFLRTMKRNLTVPMEEIDEAVAAFRAGDTVRRCSMKDPPRRIRKIFGNINELLDMYCSMQRR